jgi:hypothetical protein
VEEEAYFSFYTNDGVGDFVLPHWIINFINTKKINQKEGNLGIKDYQATMNCNIHLGEPRT